jgi:hypothetical protein
LEEEHKKAVLAEKDYEKTLAGLPRGVLVKKYVKGRQYCYLMSREKGKVRFEYRGKLMGKDVQYYSASRSSRALQSCSRKSTKIKKSPGPFLGSSFLFTITLL